MTNRENYFDFLEHIKNNPNFSFLKDPTKFVRMEDHGCSCYTFLPKARGRIEFHNFDLNSSYHLETFIVERKILAFDLYKRSDIVKSYLENCLKIKFEDKVYDDIQNGFNEYVKQIHSYIYHRNDKYKTIFSVTLKIFFDKKTDVYLGYSMSLNTHLIYAKSKGRISPMINFNIQGFEGKNTYKMVLPFSKERTRQFFTFEDSIPDGIAVIQHWIGQYNGSIDSTFEDAMRGLELIDMNITVNEMINI
jgi:hypothetical protein